MIIVYLRHRPGHRVREVTPEVVDALEEVTPLLGMGGGHQQQEERRREHRHSPCTVSDHPFLSLVHAAA